MQTNPYPKFIESLGMARLAGKLLPDLSGADRPLGEAQGYVAQAALAAWFQNNGQGEIAGYKVGATTEAMQNYLGVKTPAYGHIMSKNVFSAGARFPAKTLCKIGVECELAIIIGPEFPSSDHLWTRNDLVQFVDAIAPAIEIVENRYDDFRSSGIGTLIADDFFHRACVLGERVKDFQRIDRPAISARVLIDGEEAEKGIGAAVLGDPLEAVVWLTKIFRGQGRTLKAGEIVLTGSMTPVKWIDNFPTRVDVKLTNVGSCSVELF